MTRSSTDDSGIRTSQYQEEKSVREQVLEEKIKIDSKNHEKEKQMIISGKDQIIDRLETDTNNLKIEVEKKSEKIKQLDIANAKKEFQLEHKDNIIKGMHDENENLKQRVENLQREITHLEGERQKITERHNQTVEHQNGKIKEMEEKITTLKNEIHKVKSESEIHEKKMMEKLTMMEDKMEAREKKAIHREEERDRKMLEMEQQNEEKWIRREEKRKEEAKENMQSLKELIKSEFSRNRDVLQQDIKATTRDTPRNDNVVITEANDFQINTGGQFYREHSPVRQPVPRNGRRIQPQARISLPMLPTNTFPARRGINQQNTYR